MSTDWLLVIDMQPGFGDPSSPWATPGYDQCADRIAPLVEKFAAQVMFTRFVPPRTPEGAWIPYYRDWDFAIDPANGWLWDLDPRWAGRSSVCSPRFAKWREARGALRGTRIW